MVKVVITVLGHLNECLGAIDTVCKCERDRLPHLRNQTALEILHKHIAKELFDVTL